VNSSQKAIVLVDDEKAYIDVLASLLTANLGCPVFTFTRPREALAALPDLNPAVIVTDYYMPQLDGFEFIQRASQLVPGVPFILISGHTIHLPEDDFATLQPLRTILPKPFSWRKLADEIALHVPEFAASLAKPTVSPFPAQS